MSGRAIRRTDFGPEADLAYRWAPIHYQHVDMSYAERDMICSADFDDDWDASNNKDNLKKFGTKGLYPVVYYSVAETSRYYYIIYAFYHGDDLTHDNDLEGCLVIVNKNGGGEGELLGMITVAHYDFWSYVYGNKLTAGEEDVDGRLLTEIFEGKDHPVTKQTARKHACYAWKGTPLWETLGLPAPKKAPLWKRVLSTPKIIPNLIWGRRDVLDGRGVKYLPGNESRPPEILSRPTFRDTFGTYVLIDMLSNKGLWAQRENRELFSRWGVFNGPAGKAHAPWLWDDWNDELDANEFPGNLFFDPALVARSYFKGFRTEPSDDYASLWEKVRQNKPRQA